MKRGGCGAGHSFVEAPDMRRAASSPAAGTCSGESIGYGAAFAPERGSTPSAEESVLSVRQATSG